MVCFIIEEHEVKEGGVEAKAAYIWYWELRLVGVKPWPSGIRACHIVRAKVEVLRRAVVRWGAGTALIV